MFLCTAPTPPWLSQLIKAYTAALALGNPLNHFPYPVLWAQRGCADSFISLMNWSDWTAERKTSCPHPVILPYSRPSVARDLLSPIGLEIKNQQNTD